MTLIVAAFSFMAALAPAFAEKRVALVLGNSSYKNATPLKNPAHDATDISASLNRLGFKVIYGQDLDRRTMEKRIRDFAREIQDADVSLLYYAGHAVQVDGQNYLAPIDASLKAQSDLDFEAIPLRLIMKQMERSTRISLVFLDACRDNPLASTLKIASRSLSVGRGLAQIERASGMLIAFATKPGSVALDGEGRNSPFTRALLKHIETPGLTVNDVMINVRKDVIEATNNTQIPWENSSLTGRFFFKKQQLASNYKATSATDAAPVGSTIRVGDKTIEHTFWTSVQKANDPALYQAYLDRYPSGIFAPIAKAKLTAVNNDTTAVKKDIATPAPVVGNDTLQTAQLDPATGTAPLKTQATPRPELASLLQSELKRVGCYTGSIDGLWGKGSRAAVQRFNTVTKTGLTGYEPQEAALQIVSAQKNRVCIAPKRTRAVRAPRKRRVARHHRAPAHVSHEPAFDHSPPQPSVSFGFSRHTGGGHGGLSIGIGGGGIRF